MWTLLNLKAVVSVFKYWWIRTVYRLDLKAQITKDPSRMLFRYCSVPGRLAAQTHGVLCEADREFLSLSSYFHSICCLHTRPKVVVYIYMYIYIYRTLLPNDPILTVCKKIRYVDKSTNCMRHPWQVIRIMDNTVLAGNFSKAKIKWGVVFRVGKIE